MFPVFSCWNRIAAKDGWLRMVYLCKVDFSNAYNSLKREAVFEAVRARVPGLLGFVEWVYGTSTHILLRGDSDEWGLPDGVKSSNLSAVELFFLTTQQCYFG